MIDQLFDLILFAQRHGDTETEKSKLSMNGPRDSISSLLQFPRQSHFVDRLKQSRSKVLMQMNRAVHDHRSNLVFMHLRVSVSL